VALAALGKSDGRLLISFEQLNGVDAWRCAGAGGTALG